MSDDIELASPIVIRCERSTSWLGLQFALKRAFDLMGSLTLILFLAPIMLAAVAAVLLSSPGPVFFRQNDGGAVARNSTAGNSARCTSSKTSSSILRSSADCRIKASC